MTKGGQVFRWVHAVAVAASMVFWLAGPRSVRADFSLTYRAASASLTLFNQPQPSPFAGVELRLFIKGERIRLEAKDHWGRTHVWISDRSAQKSWRLYEDRRYEVLAGGWSCENLPVQLALLFTQSLNAGGIDSLAIWGGEAGSWKGKDTKITHWSFLARVFGLPKPVRIGATVYFPAQEAAAFGKESAELYCGSRPRESEWKTAFDQFLDVAPDGCQTLARTIGLPLALDFNTDLGMGKATLLMEAAEHSNKPLEDALFRIPEGFSPVTPSE